MQTNPYLRILKALSDNGVDLLVAGGVAAALYGSQRVTFDLDLIPPFDQDVLKRAITTLLEDGFVLRLPVSAEEASNPETLRQWITERNLIELTLTHPETGLEVGLLVALGDSFTAFAERSETLNLQGTSVRVISIEDLIALKQKVGRPTDLQDVEALTQILAARRQ